MSMDRRGFKGAVPLRRCKKLPGRTAEVSVRESLFLLVVFLQWGVLQTAVSVFLTEFQALTRFLLHSVLFKNR